MPTTPNLALPELAAAQAQKHVTHNEALRILDAVVQLCVLDRDLTEPPGAAASGDRYIVAAGATGAWAGHEHDIAVQLDGDWSFIPPGTGWLAFVADEARLVHWAETAWQPVAAQRPSFHAHKSVNQSGIAPSTATKVTFSSEEWDVGGYFDTADSRFTPPAGKYWLAARLHLIAGLEDNARAGCLIYKNGSLYKASYMSMAGTGNVSPDIGALVDANGIDYFEVYVLITGAGNKTILGNGTYSWFSGYQI